MIKRLIRRTDAMERMYSQIDSERVEIFSRQLTFNYSLSDHGRDIKRIYELQNREERLDSRKYLNPIYYLGKLLRGFQKTFPSNFKDLDFSLDNE